MKIAIITLNWNGKDLVLELLQSIDNLLAHNYELLTILVDNGSTDGTVEAVKSRAWQKELKIIENPENLGFAGGNNVGIREALKNGFDYIILLNTDTLVDKNLVQELVKVGESSKNIGIIVPKIYFAPGFEFHKDRYQKKDLGKVLWYAGGAIDWQNVIAHHRGVDEVDRGQYDREEETEFATGCCLAIKKEVFEKIGELDSKFFLYYEDADFSLRAKKAGFKVVFAPKAIVFHKNAGSGGGSGSNLQDYYITKSRLLFGLRWAPQKAKLALIRESFRFLVSGRPWQKRAVLDFYLRRFGKGSYPI